VYTKSWSCLPCGVYIFEVFDSFNDGWCDDPVSCGYYNLAVNGVEISRIENDSSHWGSQSVSFGCGSCQPSLTDSQLPSQSVAPTTSTVPSLAPDIGQIGSISMPPPVSILELSPNCANCLDVQLELKTNDYPGDTSWILKEVTTNTLIEEVPFKSLYNETYVYTKSWSCLPCGTYTFAIFDSFNDGWCDDPASCGYYKLEVNGVEISDLENDSSHWGSKAVSFSCDTTSPPDPCP
jgi:hypothetical protein